MELIKHPISPKTSCIVVRCSHHLSLHLITHQEIEKQFPVIIGKWTHWDLNPGPSACEADVIPLHHVPHAPSHSEGVSHVAGMKSQRVTKQNENDRDLHLNKNAAQSDCSRDSSVGRASDRRSEGPRFDPGSRHFSRLC